MEDVTSSTFIELLDLVLAFLRQEDRKGHGVKHHKDKPRLSLIYS